MSNQLWSAGLLEDWLKMNAPAGYVRNVSRSEFAGGDDLPASIASAIMLSLDKATPQNSYDVANGGHRVQLQHGSGAPMGTPVNGTRCHRFFLTIDPVWPDDPAAWQILWQLKQGGGGTPGIDLQYRGRRLILTDRTDTERAGVNLQPGETVEVWIHHKLGTAGFADLYVNGIRIGGFTGNTNGDGTTAAGYPCLDIYTSDAIVSKGGKRAWYCAGFQVWDGLPSGETPAPPPSNADTTAPVVGLQMPTGPQSGTLAATVAVTDNVKATSLIVGINGTALRKTINTPGPTVEVTFDISTVADGTYWIWAAAKDAVGNEGTTNASFVIARPPDPDPDPTDPCAGVVAELALTKAQRDTALAEGQRVIGERDAALAVIDRVRSALP